jgi:hypothetical protein
MAEPGASCLVPGCNGPRVSFSCFPTVVGYCLTHGNVLTGFLSLIDARGPIGFDGVRARWESAFRQRQRIDP